MDYATGYDASAYQDYYINHQGAKDDGVDFAVYRASYGLLKDGTFVYNAKKSKGVGTPVMAYGYSYPRRDAINSAEVLLEQIETVGGVAKTWWDVEETRPAYTVPVPQYREHTAKVMTFLFDELGLEKVGIYSSRYKWRVTVGNDVPIIFDSKIFSLADIVDLWVAHYTNRLPPYAPALPKGWDTWALWQFTQYGRVDWYRNGKYSIDLDRFNGSEADLREYLKMEPAPGPNVYEHAAKVPRDADVIITTLERTL